MRFFALCCLLLLGAVYCQQRGSEAPAPAAPAASAKPSTADPDLDPNDPEVVKLVKIVFELLQNLLKVITGGIGYLPLLGHKYLPVMQILNPIVPNLLDHLLPQVTGLLQTGLLGDLLAKPNTVLLNNTLNMLFDQLMFMVPKDQRAFILEKLNEGPFDAIDKTELNKVVFGLQGVVKYLLMGVSWLPFGLNAGLKVMMSPLQVAIDSGTALVNKIPGGSYLTGVLTKIPGFG